MTACATRPAHTRRPVFIIVGPTGTGKSDLALEVAARVGGEIISADSMQVYKGMDIGTAKLSMAQRNGITHHLIDVVDPDDPFTAHDWTRLADEVIADLHRQRRLPVVVGGTGLYIRSVVDDLDFANSAADPALRTKWEQIVAASGPQAAYEQLTRLDPQRAEQLHPNDVRRVIRALEVAEQGPMRMSASYDWSYGGGRYQTLQFAIEFDPDVLAQRLDRRVDSMVEAGLEQEVAALLERGYGRSLTAMQAIGYKEMVSFFCGECSRPQALQRIRTATRRFAKRQRSWFRKDGRIEWVRVGQDGVQAGDKNRIFREAARMSAGIGHGRIE